MLGFGQRRPASSSPPKVAMTRPAASPVVRSVIAGSPPPGCSALKRRATGPTSAAAISALPSRAFQQQSKIDAFGLFTGQVGYAVEQRSVLRQGRRGCDVADRFRVTCRPRHPWKSPIPAMKPAGAARSASASNTASPRTGRPRSNTITVHAGPHHHPASTTASVGVPGTVFGNDRIRQDVDLVTVRVNYRWGGPVIAKY